MVIQYVITPTLTDVLIRVKLKSLSLVSYCLFSSSDVKCQRTFKFPMNSTSVSQNTTFRKTVVCRSYVKFLLKKMQKNIKKGSTKTTVIVHVNIGFVTDLEYT